MKISEKVILAFIGFLLVGIIAYNISLESKANRALADYNLLCDAMTQKLNEVKNASSFCQDYYCYYAAYAPPSAMKNLTKTVCVCECRSINGTTLNFQILSSLM